MRPELTRRILVAMLIVATYWGTTSAMIEYSARYLSTTHSCIVWIPFNHTGFLLAMGQRSIPALRRQIADPSVGLGSKIHLTWILCQLGDCSQFPVFIRGLGSKLSHQYIAAVTMQDFPDECLRHLPAILAAGRQRQHNQYESLLRRLADKAHLSEDKQAAIAYIVIYSQERGLSEQEIRKVRQLFGNGDKQRG
jgi:hypothetical protein